MKHKSTLSKEFINKWNHLLSEVKMDEVPIELIQRLEIFFNDGRNPQYIDISEMLKYEKPSDLEKIIGEELEYIDEDVERVDFHLDVEKVVSIVDTATNEILKDLQ